MLLMYLTAAAGIIILLFAWMGVHLLWLRQNGDAHIDTEDSAMDIHCQGCQHQALCNTANETQTTPRGINHASGRL